MSQRTLLTEMASLCFRNLIVGKTGSGKTLLLRALIGEPSPQYFPSKADQTGPGSIYSKQRVAYCSSSAWLVHDTIKANILLGRGNADDFDAPAYEAAIGTNYAAAPVAAYTTAVPTVPLQAWRPRVALS